MPRTFHVALERAEILRYGENPHQQGARYRFSGATSWWDTMTQHGGKALSYLNLYDTEAAWRLVHRFDDPACVVVKHANPCGVAIGTDPADPIADAYVKANACDPVSAFGGIVAVNRTVTRGDGRTAVGACSPRWSWRRVSTPMRSRLLLAKKNMRVITAERARRVAVRPQAARRRVHRAATRSRSRSTAADWQVVTEAQPTRRSVGRPRVRLAGVCGGHQQRDRLRQGSSGRSASAPASRTGSTRPASPPIDRPAGPRVAICASDAFFPFRDGLDAAAAAGITAVIQPGGSVRDDEVIAAANEHGIAMVFTHQRHFRH